MINSLLEVSPVCEILELVIFTNSFNNDKYVNKLLDIWVEFTRKVIFINAMLFITLMSLYISRVTHKKYQGQSKY